MKYLPLAAGVLMMLSGYNTALYGGSMQSKYAEQINRIQTSNHAMEDKMLSISRALQQAVGLTDKQLNTAEDANVTWDIGGYTVIPSSRHTHRGWKTVLQITPLSTPSNFGYSNTAAPLVDDSWYYKMSGTATVIVPPEEVVQVVLQVVRG